MALFLRRLDADLRLVQQLDLERHVAGVGFSANFLGLLEGGEELLLLQPPLVGLLGVEAREERL